MFDPANKTEYQQVLDKIEMRTRAYGEKTLMSEFRLEKNAQIPGHSHPHEQTGYLISGQLQLTIGAETFLTKPGDSWSIGGDVEHAVVALEDSLVIEVFSPVRQEYLP